MADTDAAAPDAPAAPPRKKDGVKENLSFLLKLALVVFVLRSFIVSPFFIPSESMVPTLYIGDYLFISKWNYGYSRWSLPFGVPLIPGRIFPRTPERGDVVVFRGPPGDEVDVIKRVIGLPGDTVQMRGGQLILNGTPVPKVHVADFTIPLTPNYDAQRCDAANQDVDTAGKPICRYAQFRETLPSGKSYMVLDRGQVQADDTKLFQVPAGHVFVMGDNRDDSADSRFPPPAEAAAEYVSAGIGYVPLDHIEGKALFSFWSTDGSASWVLPWTWFTAARWSRMGHGY